MIEKGASLLEVATRISTVYDLTLEPLSYRLFGLTLQSEDRE